MNIVHVVPTYFPAVRYGGPIESVHSLNKALVKEGVEVHVYTTNIDGKANLAVPTGVPQNLDGVKVTAMGPASAGDRGADERREAGVRALTHFQMLRDHRHAGTAVERAAAAHRRAAPFGQTRGRG